MQKQLGFGTLRLEKNQEKQIVTEICHEMIEQFIRDGGVYFEVAYAYPHTEEVVSGLLKAYDRDQYVLTDKMPVNGSLIKKQEDYYTVFQEQLRRCEVEYFDYYLLHNLGHRTYLRSEELGAFTFLKYLKENGLAKKVGFSFHDKAEVLDEILAKYNDLIDVVQLQINYLDWDSPVIQSKNCYDVACKYGKTIFVMEPIKGGRLLNLPHEALKLIAAECPGETAASLALRFPASLDNVQFVLSGMTNAKQVHENMQVFNNLRPLSTKEKEVLKEVTSIIHKHDSIECTQCRYCEKVCPKKIPIPDLFHLYENDNKDHVGRMYIRITEEQNRGKASDCIRCGRCEQECSQRLPIRKLLADVKQAYEPSPSLQNRVKRKVKNIIGTRNVEYLRKLLKK